MPITLPLNALIRLTDLSVVGERSLNKITGFTASGGTVTLFTPTTSGIIEGSTIVISGLTGAPKVWTTTVVSKTANSFTVSGVLQWQIASARTYRTNALFYIDNVIYGTHTLKPGDVMNITATNLPATGTVSKVTNTDIVFASGSEFPGGATYNYIKDMYSELVNPGYLYLNYTTGQRTPALSRCYWALGGGSPVVTLSDHNRSPLDISYDTLEKGERMLDGTKRTQHSASKAKFSMSWEKIPADAVATVDGHAGGSEMLSMYNNNVGSFNMEVYNKDSARKGSDPESIYRVRIVDFTHSIDKRNFMMSDGRITDLWNCELQLEEV